MNHEPEGWDVLCSVARCEMSRLDSNNGCFSFPAECPAMRSSRRRKLTQRALESRAQQLENGASTSLSAVMEPGHGQAPSGSSEAVSEYAPACSETAGFLVTSASERDLTHVAAVLQQMPELHLQAGRKAAASLPWDVSPSSPPELAQAPASSAGSEQTCVQEPSTAQPEPAACGPGDDHHVRLKQQRCTSLASDWSQEPTRQPQATGVCACCMQQL